MKHLKTYKQLNEKRGTSKYEETLLGRYLVTDVIGKTIQNTLFSTTFSQKDKNEVIYKTIEKYLKKDSKLLNKNIEVGDSTITWIYKDKKLICQLNDNRIIYIHNEWIGYRMKKITYYLKFDFHPLVSPISSRIGILETLRRKMFPVKFVESCGIDVERAIYFIQKDLIEKIEGYKSWEEHKIHVLKLFQEKDIKLHPQIEEEYKDLLTASDLGLL